MCELGKYRSRAKQLQRMWSIFEFSWQYCERTKLIHFRKIMKIIEKSIFKNVSKSRNASLTLSAPLFGHVGQRHRPCSFISNPPQPSHCKSLVEMKSIHIWLFQKIFIENISSIKIQIIWPIASFYSSRILPIRNQSHPLIAKLENCTIKFSFRYFESSELPNHYGQ